jgi:hypothetical protein
MAFTKSVPDSQNPGIYTLAAVHRSSSPGFLFTTFHADTPDVERFAQAFPCRCSCFRAKATYPSGHLPRKQGAKEKSRTISEWGY